MKTAIITVFIVTMLLGVSPVQADTIWTEGHYEIVDTNVYSEIYIYNDVTLDILGGDIYKLETYDVTVTDWYDGVMDLLYVHDSSVVNIHGGDLDALGITEDALVNLHAYDVIHYPTGGHFDRGWVEGKYVVNDTPFNFDLNHLDTFSHINVVPEPATILLLGVGFLLVRRR